ncbi:ATP-binding protein [Falsibacillus albus]|uniref:histidine kinase n=1 Tax=Falsibacillus albus TaxID=2478915 RepID=A0A3L7JSZ6_9BACI|nr:ATP-binding protein [Falsibacillus albus]RLQ93836.1 two-component sensor histidine kinase [Falsibacillus albus]
MPNLITHLLPNLFYILAALFIFQLLTDRNHFQTDEKKLRWRYFVFSLSSIFLCMVLPAQLSDDFMYDLRNIPLIIGALYGGPSIGVLLLIWTVLFRAFFGGIGVLTTLGTGIVVIGICSFLSQRFNNMSIRYKLITGCAIIFFNSLILWITISLMLNRTEYDHAAISITLMEVLGMGLVIYIIEAIRSAKFLRSKILRSEKLEVVSHLAASISHEIRNPMTTTKGFLQLLKDGEKDEKNLEYIKLALDELNRAEEIVRDYLTFAKPANEKLEILDIKEQVEKVIAIIRPLANMNSVRFDLCLRSVHIKGEQSLFQQCMLNLLKNAIEAMPNGGKLEIHIDAAPDGAIIKISDSGCGMTDEQVRRLGEPYFTTKDQKGTGLGMMVVFRVVEAMKGRIKVTSELGKGTHFIIRLPRVV